MWWPPVTYREGAKQAVREGAGAAVFVAGVTALFGVLSIFGIQVFPDFPTLSLVDAAFSPLWLGEPTRCLGRGRSWGYYCSLRDGPLPSITAA